MNRLLLVSPPYLGLVINIFLLIIDMFSRYVELVPMKNQEAPTIKAALMQNWIYRHGLFNTALSDKAKNIDGETIKQLCVALNVSKKHSSPYHPEGDGMAERAIQTVKSMLRCVSDEKDVSAYRWPDLLQQVAFLFNSSLGVSTGASPFEIMYGYKPELPPTIMRNSYEPDAKVSSKTFVEELRNKLSGTWKAVGETIEKEKEKRNHYYNRNTRDILAEEGDFVYLKDHARSHSLSPKFKGPYRIL